jgi:hypothetical protein
MSEWVTQIPQPSYAHRKQTYFKVAPLKQRTCRTNGSHISHNQEIENLIILAKIYLVIKLTGKLD